MAPSPAPLAGDSIRFLLAGALNTALTFAAFQLLLFVMPSPAAYTVSWILGLLFVVWFYPDKVFVGGRTDVAARFAIGALYVILFLAGLGLITLLDWAGYNPRYSVVLVIAATTILNFVAGRLVLRGSSAPR